MSHKQAAQGGFRALAVLAFAALAVTATNAASNYGVLYNFTGGNDGGNAATGLAFDRSGNAYGTTVVGGLYGCGTVFKLSPAPSGKWSETVLYAFACGTDGKAPHGGVTLDRTGNLFGTTVAGGSGSCSGDACGTVYEVTSSGESVLHSFQGGSDGFGPGGPVVFEGAGNLYGTTPDGGAYSAGTVYELSFKSGGWQESVIHSFNGTSEGGVGSLGALLLDKAGNLYGVTEIGGKYSAGTAYELSPTSSGWRLTTLYAFKGQPDAGSPYGGLIADARGNLYGTTYFGGANGAGSVFELRHTARGHWRDRVLYSFKGRADGGSPTSTLVFAGAGNLYGTTSAGGTRGCSCGTVFSVNPDTGSERVLHRFGTGPDGSFPYYGMTLDKNGNLNGTTVAGGQAGQGAVFKITP